MSTKKPSPRSLTLTLPWIISVNALYKRRSMKSGGRGMMMTDQAHALKREIQYTAKAEMSRQGFTRIAHPTPVSLTLLWYPPSRRKIDGSNLLKLLEDSLSLICFDDDQQIHEHHLYKREVFKGGKTEVTIKEIQSETE